MDRKREAVKQWFREAKFGLFIHWGIYAVEGRGEWRRSYNIFEADYAKQIPHFTAKHFDPKAWAKLAKETGVKYIVFTTKHHDGFCMFDAHNTDWKVTNTPAKRDVLRELTEACLAEGIKVGFYYSIMDWHHPDWLPRLGFEEETRPAEGHDVMDYIRYMREQLHQLLTEYGEAPFVLWYDGGWTNTPENLGAKETNALARKWHPGLLINDRHFTKEDLITPEQVVPATGILDEDGKPALWEACITMTSHWWGYDRYETKFKEPAYLVQMLVDMVSKGGNYLLNIGPDAEGRIQPEFVERMKIIGKWLKKYGEAIYGTTASPFEKLPFLGRTTVKDSRLFVHVFHWPGSREIRLPGLKNKILKVSVLGSASAKVTAVRSGDGWTLQLPATAPDPMVSVIAVELDGAPQVTPVTLTADAKGVIALPVLYANLIGPHGQRIRYETDQPEVYVGSWYRAPDRATWTVKVPKRGEYQLVLHQEVTREGKGLDYDVYVDPHTRKAIAPNGKPFSDMEDSKNLFEEKPAFTFRTRLTSGKIQNRRVGTLALKAGVRTVVIVLKPGQNATDGLHLFGAELKPVSKATK